MSDTSASETPPVEVPLNCIEAELSRQLKELLGEAQAPVRRARMSNLVIYCDREDLAASVDAQIPAIAELHPARVLLLVAEPGPGSGELTASVRVRAGKVEQEQQLGTEQITLRASGRAVDHLAYAVRGLLIVDLPLNVWWASLKPPPLAGPLLYDLTEYAQQVIYDSIGWLEPARGVAAVASWLSKFERSGHPGLWRVASDLNWRRLKLWRRVLAQALDPTTAPGALESITELVLEHGPHAVVQAWELASWLATRLGWRVQGGRCEPNVEFSWQVQAPHGPLRIRIDRLQEGPSEIRTLKITCSVDGKPCTMILKDEEDERLSISLETGNASPRTVAVQHLTLTDLVGRQLSDRDRDPVFLESMAVAQVLAQSVLG